MCLSVSEGPGPAPSGPSAGLSAAASTAHLTRPPKHPHLSLESRLRGSRLGGDFYPTSPSSAIVFAVQPWASDTCRNTCHKRDIGVFTL